MNESKEIAVQNGSFSLAPTTFAEAQQFAKLISESDMVPKDYKGKAGNVLVAVQMGAEVGLPPMQALQNIAVINGRPCIWGDAAIALARRHPDFENIDELMEGSGESLTAICHIKRRNQKTQTRSFSVADARRAGLWTKDGPWKNYPQRMLQMRARSWAVRDVFADALKGISIREEIEDVIDSTAQRVPSQGVEMPQAKVTQREIPADKAESKVAKEEVQSSAVVATQNPAVTNAKPLSDSMIHMIGVRLEKSALSEQELCKRFGVGTVLELTADQVNAVLAWIADPTT